MGGNVILPRRIRRPFRLSVLVPLVTIALVSAGWAASDGASATAARSIATVTAAVASVATPPLGWASWNTFAAQINTM